VKTPLALLLVLFSLSLWADIVDVQILQTTDLHARVMPVPGETGSWYQLGTIIEEQRKKYPNATLLIDTGDTMQGSLLATVSQGEAALIPLHNLKYDVWVPGNHEPDFGLEHFFELAEKYRDILLCGNMSSPRFKPYPAWRLFNFQGAKIAVIGMTASYMKNWLTGDNATQCKVTLALDELPGILKEVLKSKPDCIVLACHQAWLEGKDPRQVNEIADIAEKFPEIDLILGAHSHRYFPGHKLGRGPWYVQPGFHGRGLGIVQIKIDTEKHKVIDIASSIERVNKNTKGAAQVIKGMDRWLRKAEAIATERLTPALPETVTFDGKPGIDCKASELFCLAMAHSSKSDIVFHSVLAKKEFTAGKSVTGYDLYQFVPYENTIFTAQLTIAEIEQIEAEQWAKRDLYTYCGIWGAHVKINADGSAKLLDIGGKKVSSSDARRYQVAFNSFTVAGSGRYPILKKIVNSPDAKLHNTRISTRDSVRDYLKGCRIWPLPLERWIL